jgi:hypothetical protein
MVAGAGAHLQVIICWFVSCKGPEFYP